jgi:hypothetical protein
MAEILHLRDAAAARHRTADEGLSARRRLAYAMAG